MVAGKRPTDRCSLFVGNVGILSGRKSRFKQRIVESYVLRYILHPPSLAICHL